MVKYIERYIIVSEELKCLDIWEILLSGYIDFWKSIGIYLINSVIWNLFYQEVRLRNLRSTDIFSCQEKYPTADATFWIIEMSNTTRSLILLLTQLTIRKRDRSDIESAISQLDFYFPEYNVDYWMACYFVVLYVYEKKEID